MAKQATSAPLDVSLIKTNLEWMSLRLSGMMTTMLHQTAEIMGELDQPETLVALADSPTEYCEGAVDDAEYLFRKLRELYGAMGGRLEAMSFAAVGPVPAPRPEPVAPPPERVAPPAVTVPIERPPMKYRSKKTAVHWTRANKSVAHK